MNSYFRRQLADYVCYHRNRWNGLFHVFGIVCLFLAAVLPLSLVPISGFGTHTNAACLAVLPVLTYWLLLDVSLGMAIIGAAIIMLSAALLIVNHASLTGIWLITAFLIVIGIAFQVIGHRVFERRQPALVDNPTHLLLGPMFVMAKLFIALGFRKDLAFILAAGSGGPRNASFSGQIQQSGSKSKP